MSGLVPNTPTATDRNYDQYVGTCTLHPLPFNCNLGPGMSLNCQKGKSISSNNTKLTSSTQVTLYEIKKFKGITLEIIINKDLLENKISLFQQSTK